MSQQTSQTKRRHRITGVLVSLVLHGSAVASLASLFIWYHLNTQARTVLPVAWADEATRSEVVFSSLIILGLATCLWSLLVIVSKLWKLRLAERRKPTVHRVRGAIITETLIVFPVFLLLTFGLAQMGINSMAGLLTSVATYEAGRTVAVWAPEIGHDRAEGGTVSHELVIDRVKIVAGGIVAPVVPAVAVTTCAPSQAMQRTQTGMLGALTGAAGLSAPRTTVSSVAEAFDTESFMTRGIAKHLLAYCAVDVEISGGINTDAASKDRPVLTTTVRYHHPNVMPLVGPIFTTDYNAGPWTMPNVTTVARSYALAQQMPPNPDPPKHWVDKLIDTVLPKPGMGGRPASL